MTQCKICGKETQLPFRCNYCDEFFCAEHRLPESHNCRKKPLTSPSYISSPKFSKDNQPRKKGTCPKCHRANSRIIKFNADRAIFKCWHCGLVYGQKKAFPNHYFRVRRRRFKPQLQQSEALRAANQTFAQSSFKREKRRSFKKPLTALVLISILFVSFYVLYDSGALNLQNIFPKAPSHDELVNYTLWLINSDRQQNGLQNVSLSSVDSGQQHANDMLKNNYFSHWDTQGYKPYMRYTLAGGKGAVAENCAAQLGSYFNLKDALKQIEWNMMYDDASSKWGHKDNILDPTHNKVSIGIAYDRNNIYLVQDFENDLVSWTILDSVSSQVTMQGTILKGDLSVNGVAIFFDKVGTLTAQQLSNSPYQGGYDVGATVGEALPTNWQAGEGITITASTCSQTGQSFSIGFDLSQAFARYGSGVYTLYLMTGESSSSALTTYSIWYS